MVRNWANIMSERLIVSHFNAMQCYVGLPTLGQTFRFYFNADALQLGPNFIRSLFPIVLIIEFWGILSYAWFIISTRLIDCFSSNLISSLISLINSCLVNNDLYSWHALSRLLWPVWFIISTSTLTLTSGFCTSDLSLVIAGIPLPLFHQQLIHHLTLLLFLFQLWSLFPVCLLVWVEYISCVHYGPC